MSRNLYTGITEHAKASLHRREDAQALFREQRWRGAMYLAGYSVECLLKAKLMRMYSCYNLLDLESELRRRSLLAADSTILTHQLEILLRLANGLDRLRQNAKLCPAFNLVNRWIPAWRYNPNIANSQDAEDYLNAVDHIRQCIENNL